ncbi:MAG TPA: alpha-galactosidase [Ruminiclostridium sp.]
MSVSYCEDKKLWILESKNTSYVIGLDEESNLQNVYWGTKLPYVNDYPTVDFKHGHSSFDAREGFTNLEYPAWGGLLYSEPCLKVTFSDNVRNLSLKYVGYEITENAEDISELRIDLIDSLSYKLQVSLYFRVFKELDIIEKYSKVLNKGENPMTIESIQSGNWYLPKDENYRLTYLTGRWSGETQLKQTILTEGKKIIESRRGTTSPHANPWFALDKGNAEEEHGDVWFGALAWSGNWKIAFELSTFGQLKVTGGINDFDFSWNLKPNSSFITPIFTGGYTEKGFGVASRSMHSYQLKHILPKEHANELRKVIYNSWEATYFDVDAKSQRSLAKKAASIGVEVFVIDDGWFGERNSDKAGLGDWNVNKNKFPEGLTPLIETVNNLGMDFGIWVEPEMVNPDSDLYRKHPDWIYYFPGLPRTEARNQLVLNLARTDVKEYIYNFMDNLLGKNNIKFIKWDMNRHFTEPGWPGVAIEDQKEIWVRHTLSLYEIVERLKQKYPGVVFEACSGGGGRVDLGILRRMDECWPSDNTDAFDRLKIQEGFSFAYLPKAMVAWVTDSPNWLNGRALSLIYRFHSAMMGTLGIGGNLNHWSKEEIEIAIKMISLYKEIRPVVQEGNLYRLLSPRTNNITAVEYTDKKGLEILVFAFLHSSQFGELPKAIYLKGLQATALYKVEGSDELISGTALMKRGIYITLKGDFDSKLIRIKKIESI